MNETIVKLDSVRIGFSKNIIHKDISFSVKSGESITILGPSGVGKTLILKTIIGLLRPQSGAVNVLGHAIHSLDETELQQVRQNIGMLFQGAALFDSLSVYDNIAYPLREFNSASDEEIPAIVAEKLALVGLPNIERKFPAELSGGQKKRVGLARALASNPKIILFDEPTTGLDPTATRLIDELIIKLKSELAITCISVTHDIASATRISDRWLLVSGGVIAADVPAGMSSQSDQMVIDFINGNWKNEIRVRV